MNNRVNYFFIVMAVSLLSLILYFWVRSWGASALSDGLNEYLIENNPLDEFGMTAKISNSLEDIKFEILSQEPMGKIWYDDFTYEETYDFTGYEGISSGHDLEESGAIYILSSYLRTLPPEEASKIINRLSRRKIHNYWLKDFRKSGYERLISKFDSIQTVFVRNFLIFNIECEFNADSFSHSNKKGLKYDGFSMKSDKPVLAFDYINPLFRTVEANGLSNESFELLADTVQDTIKEKKKTDPDYVKKFLTTYFKTKILNSISTVDVNDLLTRSGCDSVVVRFKAGPYKETEASLGFNLIGS